MNKARKFQLGNVLTLSGAHLIHDTYSSFFAPLLPILTEKLGLNYFSIGVLNIIQRAPSLLNPFIGWLADRVKARYFVILTPAITTISMSLLGLAPNVVILGILLFVMGLSSAFFHVPSPVMMRKISGNRIGKGMSFYMVGGEGARTIGPLIIVGAVTAWGIEGTWKLIPFGLLASAILYARLHKISISHDVNKKVVKANAWEIINQHRKIFIGLAGFTFFRGIMKASLTVYLPLYLSAKGESLWFAGFALSALEGAGVIGTILAGSLSDKLGRRIMLFIVAVFAPIVMLVFVFVSGVWVFPVLMLLGFILLASGPVILALVNETDSKHPSFINGLYMTINFGSSSLTALFVGIMADKLSIETTFFYAALIAFLTVPFVFMFPAKARGN